MCFLVILNGEVLHLHIDFIQVFFFFLGSQSHLSFIAEYEYNQITKLPSLVEENPLTKSVHPNPLSGHWVCTTPNKANRVPSKSLKRALYIVQNVTQWTTLWNLHQLQIPKLFLQAIISTSSLSTIERPLADINVIGLRSSAIPRVLNLMPLIWMVEI